MRESSTPNTEGDFVVLFEELRNGQRSVDEFLEAIGFAAVLRDCCYSFDFRCFEGSFGPEDLGQVCLQKVRKAAAALEPANTPNKRAFCGWVKTLVYRTFLDQLRTYKRPQNNGLSRSYEPVEIIDIQTPDVAYERKELYKRFMTFIKGYPEAHQIAIVLWLQGESLRDIAEALNGRGFECSYGAVRLWRDELLDAFKVSLGLKPPRKPRRRRK